MSLGQGGGGYLQKADLPPPYEDEDCLARESSLALKAHREDDDQPRQARAAGSGEGEQQGSRLERHGSLGSLPGAGSALGVSVYTVQFKAVCDVIKVQQQRFMLQGDKINLNPQAS